MLVSASCSIYKVYACASCASHWAHVDRTKWRSAVEMIQLQYLCSVVSLLRFSAVLHLSRQRVSEQSESLRYCRASRLLSLLSCRLSSHCWAVYRLLYLWTRSLACHCLLSSESSIALGWHHERHVRKPNPYILIINPLRTDLHIYKHSLRLRPHKHPPRLHNYEPHAKAFGNNTVTDLSNACVTSPIQYFSYRLYVHSAISQWKKCIHADKLQASIQGIVWVELNCMSSDGVSCVYINMTCFHAWSYSEWLYKRN